MAHTIDRARGIFKPNRKKTKRIVQSIILYGGQQQDAADLVWLARDAWARIKYKVKKIRDDLEEGKINWLELENKFMELLVEAIGPDGQGFDEEEVRKTTVIAETKVIWPENGIEDPEKERVVIVLTDDLGKGVGEDGKWKAEKYSKVFTVRFLRAMAKAIPDFPFNILVTEANFLRFRQKTSKPWPYPHPKSVLEEICRFLLIEKLKDIKPVAIFLHSSPARGMFKVKVGEPVFAGRAHLGLEKVGGLDEVAEARGGPILVEGFDHMAQARFFKAFWWWGKIAVELARK